MVSVVELNAWIGGVRVSDFEFAFFHDSLNLIIYSMINILLGILNYKGINREIS